MLRRLVALTTCVLLFGMQAAFADTTVDTATTLNTSVATPTAVDVGGNTFTIRLFASSGNVPSGKNGKVDVIAVYNMAANGVITAGTTKATVTFPSFNYSNCSSSPSQLGCSTNPLSVTASLNVAAGTPNGTTGSLTISATPQSDSGVTNDGSPAIGRVRVGPANVAPTVGEITGATTADEGSTGSYSVLASDADGDALSYAWSVTSGRASISGPANGASANVAFGDGPGTVGLRVDVGDGNGHTVTKNMTVSVANVAPTAMFAAPITVDEGTAIGLSMGSPNDLSTEDSAAGFTYAFDCGGGTFGSFTSDSTFSCPTTDNGTATVRGAIRDRDGGQRTYQATVAINNVAPSATFAASSVNEGDEIPLSFSDPSDPSTADASAGFTYAFDCGNGYGAYASTSTASCATNDSGTRTVKGKVRDKDGGEREYTITTVTVLNVAPTAVFDAPTTVAEGSAISLSLTGAQDPSSVDAASLTFAFDCGSGDGYGTATAMSSTSCAPYDNGDRTVAAKVIDKDGGYTEYTQAVTVASVAPMATFAAPASVNEGTAIELHLTSPSDPSPTDTAAGFAYAFDCGDGGGYGPASSTPTATCATTDNATLTVHGKVTDKDGAFTEYSATVSVGNVVPDVSMGGDVSIDEGGSFDRSGSFADPGDDSWTATVDYGDGSGPQSLPLSGTTFSLSHIYTDDGSYTVTVIVTDDDGGSDNATLVVTVDNVAPVVGTTGGTANEGSVFVGDGDFADPGADTWTATVDYGDGTGAQPLVLGADNAFTLLHTYGDDGSYTVTVMVTDDDGATGNGVAAATITNVAPTVLVGADAALDEGGTFTRAGNFTDPGTDDWTATVDYGEGGGPEALALTGQGFDLAHAYGQDGSYSVIVTVDDGDGGLGHDTLLVTVANVAPAVNAGADQSVDEGGMLSGNGSFIDPGADPWSATVDYGDGSGSHPLTLSGMAFSLSHVYADNGVYTITVEVSDDDTTSVGSLTVTVDNVGPSVDAGPDATIDEGSLFYSGGSFGDPGADTWSATVDYGDGPGPSALALNPDKTFGLAHVYADDGAYTVAVTVADDDGGSGSNTATVTVKNVAPTVSAGGDATVAEGSPFARHGSFADPGADTWTATVDYGDGTGAQGLALNPDQSFDLAHTYADNGSYTVTVTVADDDGAIGHSNFQLTVHNVAPQVSLGAGVSIDEGGTFARSGTFTDPGADTWSATVDYGDGSGAHPLTLSGMTFAVTHVYADNGSYTVTAVVRDDDGGSSMATVVVMVNNVIPVVGVTGGTANEGSSFTGSGSFADPGADTWTATVDYGDGTGVQPVVLKADKTFTLSHTYADDSSYMVTVVVTDDDGGTGTGTATAAIANVAPTVSALDMGRPSVVTACAVGNNVRLRFSVADPGSNDAVVGTIDWGDGSPVTSYSGRSFDRTHAYGAGAFTIVVGADDGDGGTGSMQSTISNLYTASAVLAPINVDGTSSFKKGSTIPVKIRVTDCNGAAVGTLAPQVHLQKTGAVTASVNEVVSSSAADTGATMRYDSSGPQYIYNLSTKRSGFNLGQDLTEGRYHLTITSPAFADVQADFSLKA